MKNITTVGLDLAKSVFQLHGVDERGKTVLRKTLKRAEVASFFARLAPCVIGMEACGGTLASIDPRCTRCSTRWISIWCDGCDGNING